MELAKYKLGDICIIRSGKKLPKGHDFSDMPTLHAYVRSRDIKNGHIIADNLAYISDETFSKIKRYIIEKGDVAITIVANIGDVAYCDEKCHMANLTENAVRLTNFIEDVNSKYLAYYLSMPFMKKYMESLAIGATQSKLGIYKVEKIKVLIPKISIQHRIASILSTYDTLIENNTKRIRLLEEMAENLYKEWFVRFRFPGHENVEMENGLPKGWKVQRLKQCIKRLGFGRTYKESELEKNGDVIVIDQSTNEYLGFYNGIPSHRASLEEPILLFGDHSCKFKLMAIDFSLGENVIPFISSNNKELNCYYLFYATHKLIKTEEYKRHWGKFVSMKILVPDIHLQIEFAKIMKKVECLRNKLQHQNSLLARQRDLLLPRLMSGKLEVKVKE